MYIFLGIIGELVTVVGASAIIFNAGIDSILEISKNGYKIDKSVLDEYKKKQSEEKHGKNGIKKILEILLILVPGVNLVNAGIKAEKMKKTVMTDPKIKDAIVPMSDNEKEQYKKMSTKMQKLIFTSFTVEKEEEEEFFGFIGKRPIVVDHGLTSLYYEELLPLNYTLDEVKRLNETTNFSYRIGKIDDKNVAIIGIPNPNSPVSRIKFKSEDYKITHPYEKMTEEEAKDKTFTVYLFEKNEDTDEKIEKVIEEIRQSRIDDSTTKKDLEVQPGFEQNYVSIDEQDGPVLKKTLNLRRK